MPRQPFFYTLDQVAALLQIKEKQLIDSYVWFDGRDAGVYRVHFLLAVDFSAGKHSGVDVPRRTWRVSEQELLRWLSFHKLWIYEPDPLPEMQKHQARPLPVRKQPGIVVDIVKPQPLKTSQEDT